jgi:FliI/YscN family ATPase
MTGLPIESIGRVTSVSGLTVSTTGLNAPVGATCDVITSSGRRVSAEVIGFQHDATLLMPLTGVAGLAKGQAVRCLRGAQRIGVGPGLLGRVIDALGAPIDDGPSIDGEAQYDVHQPPPDAMRRPRIEDPISVGIRSINAMHTAGRGQRLGIFAGTGVGKSVAMGMMARHTSADVTVVAMVGERGREVGDFLERDLGDEGRKRCVTVVSTSDQSPILRVRAAFAATAVAEYFRDQGADVLLLMDSVTRVAMAQRQIGLAAGEPPTTKGYTPSVFTLLPQLMERAGRAATGSITGLYTVLVEGDDLTEPISDAVRGILDGHIVLSRKLAMRGHYPAVSVLESISRLMPEIVTGEHLAAARFVQRLLATWDEIADLVSIGAYVPGVNIEHDLAHRARPWIDAFLQQKSDEESNFERSTSELLALRQRIAEAEAQMKTRPAGQSVGNAGSVAGGQGAAASPGGGAAAGPRRAS